ncbi:MAG: hypothetical protein ACR2OR_15880 [Hyphomicrobiales bacterium]
MNKKTLSLIAASGAVAIFVAPANAQDAQVIMLTQTPCQFLEPEGTDHGYKSQKKADCEAINEKTTDKRLSAAKVLELKPGKTVFKVTNKNVPYSLGFYFRGSGVINYATLPKVSGGGLTTGKTKDYAIDLKPGEYVFSCPLNNTPDYKVVVK